MAARDTALPAPEKISKAKGLLVLTSPFFASLVCNSEWIEDNTMPTMATDGVRVYWSRAFVDQCTLKEIMFVACHEIMHVAFEHCYRLAEKNHEKWNIATDFVINQLLVDEGIGEMPKMGLLNPALVKEAKGSPEEVYRLLPKHYPPKGGGSGGGKGEPGSGSSNYPGKALDELRKPTGSQAEQEQARADVRVSVAQAAQAAKVCGKLSANLERIVGAVLKPKVDWRRVVREFVSVRAKNESSYARPKRRFLGEDMYLPSLTGMRMGALAVAIDCSGSQLHELDAFAAEMRAISQDLQPERIEVIYFDSTVSHHDTFEAGNEPVIVGHGGGGTAFSPIFKFINNLPELPVACVVLTDLCCSDFGPAPDYPVLWCSTHAGTAPFGSIVYMKDGK